jgi:hypothetical protein
MSDSSYPRDLVGYGRNPPDPKWPGGARLAVQFVLNYEEGGENNILHGDPASEAFLSEIVGAQAWPGRRVDLRIRLARRFLAHLEAVSAQEHSAHRLWRRDRIVAQP